MAGKAPQRNPFIQDWMPGWARQALETFAGNNIDPSDVANPMPVQTGVPGGATVAAKLAGMLAGVAYPAGKKVFHSTVNHYDKIKTGVGGLFYAAENPLKNSAAYARSKAPGSGMDVLRGGVTMPLELDVKNAIDLTPPAIGGVHGYADAAGDLKKIEPFIPPEFAGDFKQALSYWRGNDPEAQFEGKQIVNNILVDHLLTRNPNALKDAGFDGIRYHAGVGDEMTSWAVPDPNQVINFLTKERGVGNVPGKLPR